jgi:hypothetical protein
MIAGLFFVALTGCEDMNSVNQEYLDRGESTYIARIDSAISVVGLNQVWFKWWLPGDPRIDTTEIRWVEGIETKVRKYKLNRAQNDSLIMETVLDIPEGSYTFEFLNRDSEGNRSVSVTAPVEIPGDKYIASFSNRSVVTATKFGNGYTLVWGASDCIYSDFSYRKKDGTLVSMRFDADSAEVTPRITLLDYDGNGVIQKTYYQYDTPKFQAIMETASETFNFFNDISIKLVASEPVIVNPGYFDLGGEGIGFHDSNAGHDPGSGGANFRPNLGDFGSAAMDIEGDGGNIGYSNADEWLQYTVDVLDEGYYEIDWYISVNTGSGSSCHVEVDGVAFDSYPLVNNSSWNAWRYYCETNGVVPPIRYFTPGKHTVRFQWDAGGFNFNGLRFKSVDPNNYPLDKNNWTISCNITDEGTNGTVIENMIDRDPATVWFKDAPAETPIWVMIDMQSAVPVKSVFATQRYDVREVSVEGSLNGTDWTNLGTITYTGGEKQDGTLTLANPATIQYLRLTVTRSSNSDGRGGFWEISATGSVL